MPDPISREDVRHLARLARLEIDEPRLETYRGQLADVLKHIERIMQLDVADVEPMARPLEITNRMREDVVEPSMSPDEALANAPARQDDFLEVPKIIGEQGT